MSDINEIFPENQVPADKENGMLNDMLSIMEILASNRCITLDDKMELNTYLV